MSNPALMARTALLHGRTSTACGVINTSRFGTPNSLSDVYRLSSTVEQIGRVEYVARRNSEMRGEAATDGREYR
jgi:hypothetical protein